MLINLIILVMLIRSLPLLDILQFTLSDLILVFPNLEHWIVTLLLILCFNSITILIIKSLMIMKVPDHSYLLPQVATMKFAIKFISSCDKYYQIILITPRVTLQIIN